MDNIVNWFVNSRCNLTCEYCFREMELEERGTEDMLALADILAQNNVQRVTIGGGEPLLRKDLEEILARLKQSGIFVSLHTNGTILLPRLDRLKGLVDILSLPLDSVYERQNRRMRGIPYVEMIDQIIEATQGKFKLAFKTTATKINARSLHKIYDKISRTDFDYWKVYQFRALNDAKKYENTFELPDEEFEQVKTKLSRYHDPRIHPLSKKEGHQAYVFLDNQGNISTVHPLKEENIQVGNLHTSRLENLEKCIDTLYSSVRELANPSAAYLTFT